MLNVREHVQEDLVGLHDDFALVCVELQAGANPGEQAVQVAKEGRRRATVGQGPRQIVEAVLLAGGRLEFPDNGLDIEVHLQHCVTEKSNTL